MSKFDDMIGSARADSEARVRAKEECDRAESVARKQQQAEHQSRLEAVVLPLLEAAQKSCSDQGFPVFIRPSWKENAGYSSTWIWFELKGPRINNSHGGYYEPQSARLKVSVSGDLVNFELSRNHKSTLNRSLPVSSDAKIEELTEMAIKQTVESYFSDKEANIR